MCGRGAGYRKRLGGVTTRGMKRFLDTEGSVHLLFTRVVLGAVLLPHGLQKVLGWFGGYGWHGTLGYFTDTLGVPAPLAVLVLLAESLGAIALIVGAGTRLAAVGAVATMLGAIALVHAPHGFFMNWSGAAAGEGFEYHLLAIGLALPLVVRGGGLASVDRAVARRLDEPSRSMPAIAVRSAA